MPGPYTLKIHIAEGNTPKIAQDSTDPNRMIWKGEISSAGHMWYSIREGDNLAQSYGFAPEDDKDGIRSVAGKVTDTDSDNYHQPLYERTMEISKEQYDRLMEFGQAGLQNNWQHFDNQYHSFTNSCVDFTWNALRHAELEWREPGRTVHGAYGAIHRLPESHGPIRPNFEGDLIPRNNRNDVDNIIDPVPDSPYNHTHHGPAAKEVLAGLRRERAEAFRDHPKAALERFPEYAPLHAADATLEAVSQTYSGSRRGNAIVARMHRDLANRLEHGASIPTRQQAFKSIANALDRGQYGFW